MSNAPTSNALTSNAPMSDAPAGGVRTRPAPRTRLNRAARLIVGIGLAIGLSGCIVVPYHPYHPYHPYYYGGY